MDSVFFKSVLVQPPVILGRQLRHFSAYHALVLLQFDSPFITGAKSYQINDILFAIFVLSEGIEDHMRSFCLFERSRLYRIFCYCKMLFASNAKIIADLQSHIDCYFSFPKVWQKEEVVKSGKDLTHIPWPFKVVTNLWRQYPMTEQEAWNMPLSRASCYVSSWAEDMGTLELADEQMIERAKNG